MISFNTDVILPHKRPEFAVVKRHSIPELHGSLFAAKSPQLRVPCPKATRFNEQSDQMSRVQPGLLTHKSLWPSVTSNCGGLRPRTGTPVTQKYCGLRPQQTVAVSGGKIPYVFREVVTKLMKHKSATAETDCYTKYEIHQINLDNKSGQGPYAPPWRLL